MERERKTILLKRRKWRIYFETEEGKGGGEWRGRGRMLGTRKMEEEERKNHQCRGELFSFLILIFNFCRVKFYFSPKSSLCFLLLLTYAFYDKVEFYKRSWSGNGMEMGGEGRGSMNNSGAGKG